MPTEKLPVIATAKEAIKLPLIHWREFLRFASILIPLSVVSGFISALIGENDASTGLGSTPSLWSVLLQLVFILALSVAFVPFAVAWIRLAINGPGSVAHRDIWTFGKVERGFVMGGLLLALITLTPPFVVFGVALVVRNQTALMVMLILLAAALLVVGWGCYVRLWFVLVELALQRYHGPRASWDQTRGKIWRLIGLGFAASFPLLVVGEIWALVGEELANQVAWSLLMVALRSAFTLLANTAGLGALALAYKFTLPEPSNTGTLATS